MKTRYCGICKKHIELSADRTNADAAFFGAGHDDTPVARTQRDPGRKQRPWGWTRPGRTVTNAVSAVATREAA